MKNIRGDAETREVYIGLLMLDPEISQMVVNHSPDGFNWGYSGSGPAQLALSLLLYFTDVDTALRLYQRFKFEIIAKLPQGENWEMDDKEIEKWLEAAN